MSQASIKFLRSGGLGFRVNNQGFNGRVCPSPSFFLFSFTCTPHEWRRMDKQISVHPSAKSAVKKYLSTNYTWNVDRKSHFVGLFINNYQLWWFVICCCFLITLTNSFLVFGLLVRQTDVRKIRLLKKCFWGFDQTLFFILMKLDHIFIIYIYLYTLFFDERSAIWG